MAKMYEARGASDNVNALLNIRSVCETVARSAGSTAFVFDPGAYAPVFMLSPTPQASNSRTVAGKPQTQFRSPREPPCKNPRLISS